MNELNKQNAKPNITKTAKSEKIISIKRHCGCGNDLRCCRTIDSNYCHVI